MRKGLVPILLISFIIISSGFFGSVSLYRVSAAPPAQGSAIITSPQSLTTVHGNVVIEGSASHPDFWKYEVHYATEPNPSNWIAIGSVHETPVMNGRLETWNTGLVPDGSYSLRLRVARRDGNYDEYYVRQITVSNSQPTETPTPEESPTPTDTPTPMPPTATIMIEQPMRPTSTPTPEAGPGASESEGEAQPTSTPSASASSEETGFTADALMGSFCNGGKVVLIGFGIVGALAAFRKGIVDAIRWGLGRAKREDDELED